MTFVEVIKKTEKLFRQQGIEAEDVFYALCARYLEYNKINGSNRLINIKEKGGNVLSKVKNEKSLNNLINHIMLFDPNGENLPVFYQYFLAKRYRDFSGKFFTPRRIASAMVSLLPMREDSIIMDPTCGGGTFLIEASKKWGSNNCQLLGNDVDELLIDLTEIVLYLGTPNNHNNRLFVSNIFEPTNDIQNLFGTIDYILANPPFSLPIDSIGTNSKLFSLGYRNSDALFIDIAYNLLKPGGRLVCLLPHSIISNSEYERLRKSIEEDWCLMGIIILPEGVFQLTSNTTTRADITILIKKDIKHAPSKAIFCNVPSVGLPLNSRDKNSNENELLRIISSTEVIDALNL